MKQFNLQRFMKAQEYSYSQVLDLIFRITPTRTVSSGVRQGVLTIFLSCEKIVRKYANKTDFFVSLPHQTKHSMLLFADEELENLYINGTSRDKRLRKLPKEIVKQYRRKVTLISQFERRTDFFQYNSLNYEVLAGSGKESVRLNDKYRLIFHTTEDNSLVITDIEIPDINNHYGDNG